MKNLTAVFLGLLRPFEWAAMIEKISNFSCSFKPMYYQRKNSVIVGTHTPKRFKNTGTKRRLTTKYQMMLLDDWKYVTLIVGMLFFARNEKFVKAIMSVTTSLAISF